jgi:hypothetical protein
MSIPQTNFENNNRMSELTKNINDIFGYILLYSVIIFTTLSAVFGGVVVYPIYTVIYMFNKIKAICCTSEAEASEAEESEAEESEAEESEAEEENEIPAEIEPDEIEPDKKPIIDENWCNVSVKNIINFESEVSSEAEEAEEAEDISNAEDEVEEVLSIRRPSEEELKQFQKEEEDISNAEDEDASEAEADDYSPKDKYSIGHYKSKTHIKDPLDFDN